MFLRWVANQQFHKCEEFIWEPTQNVLRTDPPGTRVWPGFERQSISGEDRMAMVTPWMGGQDWDVPEKYWVRLYATWTSISALLDQPRPACLHAWTQPDLRSLRTDIYIYIYMRCIAVKMRTSSEPSQQWSLLASGWSNLQEQMGHQMALILPVITHHVKWPSIIHRPFFGGAQIRLLQWGA